MISSIIVKKLTKIQLTKIEINIDTGKMMIKKAKYNMTSDDLVNQMNERHRVVLPCRIKDNGASFYVPVEWDVEALENYTQALLDEMYLYKKKLPGYKTIEQIESSFILEIVLL